MEQKTDQKVHKGSYFFFLGCLQNRLWTILTVLGKKSRTPYKMCQNVWDYAGFTEQM